MRTSKPSLSGNWVRDGEGAFLLWRADVEDAEAHLVGGAFTPLHVVRRALLSVDDRLIVGRVVPMAFQGELVARLDAHGILERVQELPVEVPAWNIEQARAPTAGTL